MQFYVYNDSAVLRWSPNQRVYAQPGEMVQVSTYNESDNCNMVVYKQNTGLSYNVKKNHLHVWTDSEAKDARMTMLESNIEDFKKTHQEREKQEPGTNQLPRPKQQELDIKELVKNELKEQKKQQEREQEPKKKELIGKMKKLGFDW